MEIWNAFSKANKLTGPILSIGFGKGSFTSSILEKILEKKVTHRNFIAFDAFNKFGGKLHPRWAIDFKNNAINKAGVDTKIEYGLVQSELNEVLKNYSPSITYIDSNRVQDIAATLEMVYNNTQNKSLIIVEVTDKDKLDSLNKFCETHFININFASEKKYSYIIKGDKKENIERNTLAKLVSNKVKRERSLNLT